MFALIIVIIILVSIALIFSNLAHSKNLNRYVWGFIGVISYYVAQLLAGIFIAFFSKSLKNNQEALFIIGILAGCLGVGIAYFILLRMPNVEETQHNRKDLLDSDFK
jgi:ABC-type transport system involved in multi-copper enzyme maturation permease subunit